MLNSLGSSISREFHIIDLQLQCPSFCSNVANTINDHELLVVQMMFDRSQQIDVISYQYTRVINILEVE